MTRNLKVLGLALVAMFAMSAVVASAASADLFHSEVPGATVTVSGEEAQVFTYEEGAEVSCETIRGEGVLINGFVDEDGSETGPEVTFAPEYDDCVVPGVGDATVDFNGCHYLFTEPNNETLGAAHVECEGTNTITIEVFLGDDPGTPLCDFHIGTQTDLKGHVKYTNIAGNGSTTREVTLTPTISGIDATKTNTNLFGFLCGAASSTNGTYDGDVTVKGEEGVVQKGIWVS